MTTAQAQQVISQNSNLVDEVANLAVAMGVTIETKSDLDKVMRAWIQRSQRFYNDLEAQPLAVQKSILGL